MISKEPDLNMSYRTDSGQEYPLEFFNLKMAANDLIYQPNKVREACRQGCSNYGKAGGCPPRAPLLFDLVSPQEEMWLIACRFWSKYKPSRVAQSRNSAIHWKFQDGIVARVMNNLGHSLNHRNRGFFLSTGYCMGCPGKKCNFKLGNSFCRSPEKRTYSMEATGINVVETVKKHFKLDMYWYSPGKVDIPYMLKCIAFIPKQDDFRDDETRLKKIYNALESNVRLTKL